MTLSNLLKPLRLSEHLTLPNRLLQAPLAGYSCAPFRVITQRHGSPGLTSTEMISGHDLAHRVNGARRYLYRSEEEHRVSYQISGHATDKIAIATTKVCQAGADIIDLNAGCPVKKIRSRQQGSKLLRSPETLHQLIVTMKNHSDVPISLKMRVGEPAHDSHDIEVAQAAEAAGAAMLTVHGRHWTERYDVPVRMQPIARVVQAVSIPVIANGDVSDVLSAQTLLRETGAAGIMIARASVGDPWLFQEILAQAEGRAYQRPDIEAVGEVFKQHIAMLIELDDEKLAILQSRKLAKYYARTLASRSEFVIRAQCASTANEQYHLIDQYFKHG